MEEEFGREPVSGSDGAYAVALREMAQRYEGLVRGLSILREIDAIDDPGLALEEICTRLAQIVAQGVGAENGSLMLFDEEGLCLEMWGAFSPTEDVPSFVGPDDWHGKRFRVGEGVAGAVAACGRPSILADVSGETAFIRIPNSPVSVRALMCYPLRATDKVVGVMNLSHSVPAFFSEESQRVLGLVADRCGRLLASHVLHHRHRQSLACSKTIVERSGDGVLVFDRHGRLTSVNGIIAGITGLEGDGLIRGTSAWIAGIPEEDRGRFLQHRARMAEHQAQQTIEYRFLAADGVHHHFEERSCAVHDSSGRFRGFVSVIRDITQRRFMEQEKAQLEEQLRHAQKMEAVGQLAGGVAHDFNNLLTGVLGNISLAQVMDSAAAIRPLLADAEAAARRAAELTQQLLIFSRKSQVAMKPAAVPPLLREIDTIIRNTFDRRIAITFDVAADLRLAFMNPSQIHQVVLNLCVNARDALLTRAKRESDAELYLEIIADNRDIDEEYCRSHVEARPGSYVCITVADNGAGMDADTRERAFEPFFTTKATGEGTGLGLAIAYGIVKQHGGWIRLTSSQEKGSRFRIYLQTATRPETVESEQETPMGGAPGGNETILLMDDEEIVLNVGLRVLEILGYTVLTARDGQEGLAVYERECKRIDAAIIDLSMPKLSGEEVVKRIRAVDPEAKLVVSTGHSLDAPAELQGPYAPSAYLRKPYTSDVLANTLRQVLDTSGPGSSVSSR